MSEVTAVLVQFVRAGRQWGAVIVDLPTPVTYGPDQALRVAAVEAVNSRLEDGPAEPPPADLRASRVIVLQEPAGEPPQVAGFPRNRWLTADDLFGLGLTETDAN